MYIFYIISQSQEPNGLNNILIIRPVFILCLKKISERSYASIAYVN